MSKPEKKEEGVKVFLRIRPFNSKEIRESRDQGEENPCCVLQPLDASRLEFLDPAMDFAVKECMSFDEIFWSLPESQAQTDAVEFATQEYVYNQSGKVCVAHCFEGYNNCLLAYGQTGSGKTHSMLGSLEDEGIIPRVCKEIFATAEEKRKDPKNTGTTYKISVSFLEIYNEKVKDLLPKPDSYSDDEESNAPSATSPRGSSPKHSQYKDLRIRLHPHRGPFVEGLTEEEVFSWADCNERISYGFSHRTTKATQMNAVSSRSHAIFKIELTQSMKVKGPRAKQVHTIASINLVDLAGSERANRTGAKGDTLTEGIAINQSLTVLRKVIEALMENGKAMKESHDKGVPYKPVAPPYRESTLTWLLSESFGGNSKTMMIAAASPHESNAEETLQTLKYALKTREIVNTVTRNEDKGMRMLREKNEEIENLKAQLVEAAQGQAQSPQAEARVQEITEKLKAEEDVRKQLMEEHDKLSKQMEEREEVIKETEKKMQRASEELVLQQKKANEEAEHRARTQRAADIMGKWTRGVALSIDSQRNKKLKQRDQQLQEKDEELQKVAAEKRRYEDDEKLRLEEVARLERDFTQKKTALSEELNKEKEKLRSEHAAVVAVYKDTLEADNERLQKALLDLRTDFQKTKAQLEYENERLVQEITKTAADCNVVRQGLSASSSTLESTKADNKFLHQEAYELKNANVRLREENSKLRLSSLKAEDGNDPNSTALLALKRDIKSLEVRIADLLDDRAQRFKEIALLKADKKALQMENQEHRAIADQAKNNAFSLESKLQAKTTEFDAFKKQMKAEEERRRAGGTTWEEEQIIELQSQLELARRAKETDSHTLKDVSMERETLKHNIRRLVEEHSLRDVDERGFDERFPAAVVGLGEGSQQLGASGNGNGAIALTGTVRVGYTGPEPLQSLKVVDSKVSQCRKVLLELRLQPPEPQTQEEVKERQEALQQQMSALLAETAKAVLSSYESIKSLSDTRSANEAFSEWKTPFESQEPLIPASAELQAKVEYIDAEKTEALHRLSLAEDEIKALRESVVPAAFAEHLQEELEQALAEIHDLQQSAPEEPQYPSDVASLQEELEEAKADVEFQEEMKGMLEEQLDDLKDFEMRYQKLQACLDGLGIEGDGDVDVYITELESALARLPQLEADSVELKEAKQKGIGASAEDYDFCATKARVLEETLKEVSAVSATLEGEVSLVRYELQQERELRGTDAATFAAREAEILGIVNTYEADVREGFAQCQERHEVVWKELVLRRRGFAELKKRAYVRPLQPEDVADLEQECVSQEVPRPTENVENVASPELAIEEILLSRHERLSLTRKALADTIHAYSAKAGETMAVVAASPALIVTEPSPEKRVNPPPALSAAHTPRFAFSAPESKGTTPVRNS